MQRKTTLMILGAILGVAALSVVGYLWWTEWSKPDVEQLVSGDTVAPRFENYVQEIEPSKTVYEDKETGDRVVVDVYEPLPEVVEDEILAALKELGVTTVEGLEEAREVVDTYSEETQKSIIYVYMSDIDCAALTTDALPDPDAPIELVKGYTFLGSFTGGVEVSACKADGTTYTDEARITELLEEAEEASENEVYVYVSDQTHEGAVGEPVGEEYVDDVELNPETGEPDVDQNGDPVYEEEFITEEGGDPEEGWDQPTDVA